MDESESRSHDATREPILPKLRMQTREARRQMRLATQRVTRRRPPHLGVPQQSRVPRSRPAVRRAALAAASQCLTSAPASGPVSAEGPMARPLALDPNDVDDSYWGKRRPDSFLSDEFRALVDHIRGAGRNSVPVLVRPHPRPESGKRYELLYGQRRLRACREAGVDVHATVESISSPREAAARIAGEARGCRSLSVFEKGVFFDRMLARGDYPTQKLLATHYEVSESDLGRMLFLARLPTRFFGALSNPQKLTCAHAKELRTLWKAGAESLFARSQELVETHGRLEPVEWLELLACKAVPAEIGISNTKEPKPRPIPVVRWEQAKLILEFDEPFSEAAAQALKRDVENLFRNSAP